VRIEGRRPEGAAEVRFPPRPVGHVGGEILFLEDGVDEVSLRVEKEEVVVSPLFHEAPEPGMEMVVDGAVYGFVTGPVERMFFAGRVWVVVDVELMEPFGPIAGQAQPGLRKTGQCAACRFIGRQQGQVFLNRTQVLIEGGLSALQHFNRLAFRPPPEFRFRDLEGDQSGHQNGGEGNGNDDQRVFCRQAHSLRTGGNIYREALSVFRVLSKSTTPICRERRPRWKAFLSKVNNLSAADISKRKRLFIEPVFPLTLMVE